MTLSAVKEALTTAKAISWDGCHKIYVLMDNESAAEQEALGYSVKPAQLFVGMEPGAAFAVVEHWLNVSCGMRFVYAVTAAKGAPNDGFTRLIGQDEDIV